MNRRRFFAVLGGLVAAVLAGWRSVIKWPASTPVGPPPPPPPHAWQIARGMYMWVDKDSAIGRSSDAGFEYWDGRGWRKLVAL